MPNTPIGKLPESEACNFISRNSDVTLGSKSKDGTRRLLTSATGDRLQELRSEIESYGGTVSSHVPQEPAGLGDLVKSALSAVGITEERVSGWLGAPCNCSERVEKLNQLGEWAKSVLKGQKMEPPFQAKLVMPKQDRIVVGCIHEGTVDEFKEHMKHIAPFFLGNRPSPSSHRRILAQAQYEAIVRREVMNWNEGTERPEYDTPYVPGRWQYAVTTVPSRITTTLPITLNSLVASGFEQPDLYIDGILPSEIIDAGLDLPVGIVHERHNVKTFSHWHLTLLDMYSRNPWAQFYAIFQDDFVCVKNLKAYIESSYPAEKCYLNLFTFMENEAIVQGVQGWVESAKTGSGRNMGRGAVGLVFGHDAVEALLSSNHMIVRRRDAQRRHISLDGAVVESMNDAGYSEFVHAPSLLQHIGTESSMGNKQHPIALTFPGEDFDPLTLLKESHAPPLA